MSEPIPIAFVIDQLVRGGAEKILVALANELDPERYRVHVITTRQPGELRNELLPHVQFHNLDRKSRWDFGALFRFAKKLDELDVRIVHTHSHSSSYYVRFARPLSPRRWKHVVHDHYGPIESSPRLRFLDCRLLGGIDYYFGVAEHLNDYAGRNLRLPEERREYLRNGVALPETFERTASERFTVVQVGRINATKNQLLAVEAADLLRSRIPNLQWLLIGCDDPNDKGYGEECRREVERRKLNDVVKFLGEQGDVSQFLRQADVGVLTSRYEGLSIALLEYMAHGLPVVATDVGACRDVVEPADGGAIVPSENAVAFAEAIHHLASDRARATTCGASNRRYVREQYGMPKMAERVMTVYDRVLGCNTRRTVTSVATTPAAASNTEDARVVVATCD